MASTLPEGIPAPRRVYAPFSPPSLRDTPQAALQRPGLLAAGACALALVVYNNVMYAWHPLAFPPEWLLYPRAIALPLLAVWWATTRGLTVSDLGLARGRLVSGTATGLALAGLAAAPLVLFLVAAAFVDGGAFSFRNVDRVSDSVGYALYWAFLLYPLHTVLFEEVLFRGVLQGLSERALPVLPAMTLTAAAFALWHVAVDIRVLGNAGIAQYPPLLVILHLLVLAALFAGGLFLCELRRRTGSVLAPAAFHWGFLTLLAGTLFVLAQ